MIFVQFQHVSILLGNRYQYVFYNMQIMSEIGLAEYFGMGEAVGIIVTLFVILYFSRKQIQSLSVDIETRLESDASPEIAYAYHILYTFAHVFHLRQRKVLSDNEWTGWLRWMNSAFEQGTIKEIWKGNIEMEKWFDPAFQEFIDKELIPMRKK
jgi:hypothetical protein